MLKMINFQNDLKKGISINEALKKHQLTLSEAMQGLHRLQRPPKVEKKYTRVNKHIWLKNGNYYIKKTINHQTKYFGSFNTLEDAERVVEEYNKTAWDFRRVDSICKKLNINRRKKQWLFILH